MHILRKFKFLGKKGCISVLAIFVPVIEYVQFYVCVPLILSCYLLFTYAMLPFFFFFLLNHKVCLNYYLMNVCVILCCIAPSVSRPLCVHFILILCVCAWMDVYFVQTKISVICFWNKFFIIIIVLWFILYFTLHFLSLLFIILSVLCFLFI